jgi:heme-degrading monooxygenase HmoA
MAKFARVSVGQSDPARFDEGVAKLNEMVASRVREMPGFQHAYWLGDRATGKWLSVVVFDSEEHLRQTDEIGNRLRQQAAGPLGGKFTAVEAYEVAAEA